MLAGVNGAGKSSIGGAAIRDAGGEYFNPDEVARQMRQTRPRLGQTEANAAAWLIGKSMLERAIEQRLDFAFETTLGATTMTSLLISAARAGFEIHLWYAGLASPELHIQRVKARVLLGGHDISETDIRRRYDHSRLNLIRLLPWLCSLRVFDNSRDADPAVGRTPTPTLVLHLQNGVMKSCAMEATPHWARPIVAAALKSPAAAAPQKSRRDQ